MPGLMAWCFRGKREGDKGLCALWKIRQSKSLRLSFSLEIQDTTLLQIYWIAADNNNKKKQTHLLYVLWSFPSSSSCVEEENGKVPEGKLEMYG